MILDENLITRAVKTSINELMLNENAETNNVNAAKQYMRKELGMDAEISTNVIVGIKQSVPNVRLLKMKYALGIARLYCNKQLEDATTIHKLNKIIYFPSLNEYAASYDRNLNNLSFSELDKTFAPIIAKYDEGERLKSSSQENERTPNANYQIVRINSFDDAFKYRENVDWCVCREEDAYDRYVGDNGSIFYFCLLNGYENIKDERSKGYPYDEYGLSMIAVSVDINGNYETCTLRWNHNVPNEYDAEHMLNVSQLEELLGVNFYKTFIPMTKEEAEKRLYSKLTYIFEEGYDELDVKAYGVDLDDEDSYLFPYVFKPNPSKSDKDERTMFIYVYNNTDDDNDYCIIVDDELEPIINMAFTDVELIRAKDSIVVYRNGNSANLLSLDGKFLLDEWQDGIKNHLDAKNPFLLIQKGDKWNAKFENGKWLLKDGVPYINYNQDGGFFVINDNKRTDSPHTIVTLDGKLGLPFKIVKEHTYKNLWFIMFEGESTYKIYDKHTLKPLAPWNIKERHGIYGFVYYIVKFEGDNEKYYLDDHANVFAMEDRNNFKLIKKNPYLQQ